MKKMMLMMVMMLTIVVSTQGKNYTDKKNEVLVSFGISVNNHSITNAKDKCKTCCCKIDSKCNCNCKCHKRSSCCKKHTCNCKKCQHTKICSKHNSHSCPLRHK